MHAHAEAGSTTGSVTPHTSVRAGRPETLQRLRRIAEAEGPSA